MVEDFALGAMLLPDRSVVRNDPLLLKHQLQPPHVSWLNTETLRIVQTPELKERLAKLASEPLVGTPEQFAAFQKAEIAKWAKVVKAAGVRLD